MLEDIEEKEREIRLEGTSTNKGKPTVMALHSMHPALMRQRMRYKCLFRSKKRFGRIRLRLVRTKTGTVNKRKHIGGLYMRVECATWHNGRYLAFFYCAVLLTNIRGGPLLRQERTEGSGVVAKKPWRLMLQRSRILGKAYTSNNSCRTKLALQNTMS